MEPVRTTFWNIPKWAEILQYAGGAIALLVFAGGVYLRVKSWRQGRPESLLPGAAARLRAFLLYGMLQWRLSRTPSALAIHGALFGGMGVLMLGTVAATVDWEGTRLLLGFQFLKGGLYPCLST